MARCGADHGLLLEREALYGRSRPADDGLVFDLDFNGGRNGTPANKSSNACTVQTVGVEACQGVGGYSIRLPGRHACVAIDLPVADRMLNAFSPDLWVSPEEAAHQEVVTAASARSGFDDLPIKLRWRTKGENSWGVGLSHDGG